MTCQPSSTAWGSKAAGAPYRGRRRGPYFRYFSNQSSVRRIASSLWAGSRRP
jgi:hypothetical protein